MLKRYVYILLGVVSTIVIGFSSIALGQDNPIDSDFSKGNAGGTNTNVAGADQDQGQSFIQVVQNFVNWVLGIMGLVALVILLWGGFLMVTAAGDDERYKKGFTILKQAGIGILFIGVAWFVVSLIFTLISIATPN